MSAVTQQLASAIRSDRRVARKRDALVLGLLAVLVLALCATMLLVGDVLFTPDKVWRALTGATIPGVSFTVQEIRLPRAIGAMVAGVAFGISGAVFQTLLRNALASPDVIGINAGASAAAVAAIALGFSGISAAGFAFLGALVTAALVWLLAYRRGFSDLRFVLVGVAVGTGLQAVVAYALTKIQLAQAQQAVVWMTGSLGRSLWDTVTPALILVAVLIPAVLVAARPLGVLRLGDDVAAMLGTRVQVSKIVLILIAVALTATATSVTGPIAFVAFLSGPIAMRLVHHDGLILPAAALIGAALVSVADLIGQHLPGATMPAGVITGIAGGPVLLWLLLKGKTRL